MKPSLADMVISTMLALAGGHEKQTQALVDCGRETSKSPDEKWPRAKRGNTVLNANKLEAKVRDSASQLAGNMVF